MERLENIAKYGFAPVPRDPDVLLAGHPSAGGPAPQAAAYALADLPFPDGALVRRAKVFVQAELSPPTWNHSHRVFVYGTALVREHFPEWAYDPAAYYLSCLFHDIGTAERYLATTKLSFEFKGAIVAREFILEHGGEEDLADAVCEAIIRHQDIFVKGGNITAVGQVLQLATIIDNVGLRANLLSTALIEETVAAFPRLQWAACFAGTIERELALKPWCHTSTFEVPRWAEGTPSNFATDVRGNEVMNKYDDL